MAQTSGEGVVGSIAIELDRKSYAPGDTVSGSVLLTALEPIRAKEPLAVVITGKELVQWDEADSTSANQDNSFLNHKIILTPNVTNYSPGESAFLFKFELPPASAVPPSFLVTDFYSGKIERLHAEIKYAATVWLTAADRASVAYLTATESFKVVISPQQLDPPVRAFEVSASERIRFLCCFHRGGLHVTSSTPKDVFMSGETINLQCHVDNRVSKTPIKRITIELVQDLGLRNQESPTPQHISRSITKLEFGGPPPGETWEQVISIPTIENGTSFSSEQPQQNQMRPLDPCVAAKFFSCSYRLVVRCKPLASRSVRMELPVRIVHSSKPVSPNGVILDVGRTSGAR